MRNGEVASDLPAERSEHLRPDIRRRSGRSRGGGAALREFSPARDLYCLPLLEYPSKHEQSPSPLLASQTRFRLSHDAAELHLAQEERSEPQSFTRVRRRYRYTCQLLATDNGCRRILDLIENPRPINPMNGEPDTQTLALWREQLRNAVTLASKQDRIVWTIFGLFSAGGAYLAIRIATEPPVGKFLMVSIVGAAMSSVWALIQHRAIQFLDAYEKVIKSLEERLRIPTEISVHVRPKRFLWLPVRWIMRLSSIAYLAFFIERIIAFWRAS